MPLDTARTVEFRGEEAGEAPFTWGQLSIWRSIQWLDGEDHYFNAQHVVDVPADCKVDDVCRALATLASRHQTLRTRYVNEPDGPRQIVERTGSLRLALHESANGAARQEVDRLVKAAASTSFTSAEWPWRVLLIVEDGTPRYLGVVLNHQAIDGWALNVISGQLVDAIRTATPTEPARPWQPLDQVVYEATGEGRQRGEISLRYWRDTLARVPRSMFDYQPQEPQEQRFLRLEMNSPATAVAASLIANRLNLTTSAVLLAASASVLGVLTGHDEVVMQLIVANRFDAVRRTMVAAMAEDGLFAVSVADASFDDVVVRTHRAALATYRYGYYDTVAVADLKEAMAAERGGHLDLSAFFNDTRFHDRWEALPLTAPSADELRVLTTRTRVSFVGSWKRQDAKFFMSAAYAPDTSLLQLMTDTAFIPPDRIEAVLRAVETLLVATAFDEARMRDVAEITGLAPVRRGPGWVACDNGWVDVSAVQDLVRTYSAVDRCAVFAEPSATGGTDHRLTAYLNPPGSPPSIPDLRAASLAAARTRTDLVTPHSYVLCAESPGDLADHDGWRQAKTIGTASGRP